MPLPASRECSSRAVGVSALDMADWLCGFENLMLLEHDQPAFVEGLLEMIHVWNQQRMAVVLSGKVDLFIYRAWYEGCDFVNPKFYRKVILPRLKSDAALAHEHGAMFGYICSSGILPLLDDFLEAGIDVLIGIDPVQGTKTDLAAIRKKTAGRISFVGRGLGSSHGGDGRKGRNSCRCPAGHRDAGAGGFHPFARR